MNFSQVANLIKVFFKVVVTIKLILCRLLMHPDSTIGERAG